jgi:hypothetical protein
VFDDLHQQGDSDMTQPAAATASEAMADDNSIGAVLARFNGNAHAALECALSDIAFLQKEITYASLAMSYGFARGWRPSIERPADQAIEQA